MVNKLTPELEEIKRKARRHLDSHFRNMRLFGAQTTRPANIQRDLSPAGDFYLIGVFDSAGNDYQVKFRHHHDGKVYFESVRDVKAPTVEDIARSYLLDLLSKKGTQDVCKIRYGSQAEDILKAARKILSN